MASWLCVYGFPFALEGAVPRVILSHVQQILTEPLENGPIY